MKNSKRSKTSGLVPEEIIEGKIFLIRGKKVMLDRDLAELYGVETKHLNRQVKRNSDRFPEDFMFQLNKQEKTELVTKCHRFNVLKHSSTFPFVFTEHGTLMLANVLKSVTSMEMSIAIVRTFIKLREMIMSHKDLQRKIEKMEKKYDHQFKVVFEAIKQLITPVEGKPKKQIGFHRYDD